MKRDWDKIREIMLDVEQLGPDEQVSHETYESDASTYHYHAILLMESGLAEGEDLSCSVHPDQFWLDSLTWEGHEFLDGIRDKKFWEKIKSTVSENGGAMTFDVIKTVVTTLVKTALA